MAAIFYLKICHLWKRALRILDADELLLRAAEIAKADGLRIDRRVFRTAHDAVWPSVQSRLEAHAPIWRVCAQEGKIHSSGAGRGPCVHHFNRPVSVVPCGTEPLTLGETPWSQMSVEVGGGGEVQARLLGPGHKETFPGRFPVQSGRLGPGTVGDAVRAIKRYLQ